ncbi:PRC-barrel domain-containing protein [Halomonas sp. CKK8]|uniref:PRC-barrel domain-containing protein n=1 Tax=Halomonas sp. CKK8 TaxID=3036127 RepID=UPI0024155444|nr:PRC-barrel domain-containing protein [Halomonas sp. CKK8]WFM70670.1 PRC-barrel domain-containing protein [Halomonas sp. CKK8]
MNDTTMQSKTGHVAIDDKQPGAMLLSGSTITGDDIFNMKDENLGKIQDIMLDVEEGKIRYVVLATGGFMGMGDRLFAIPWKALKHDATNRRFLLDVEIDRLKKAPGFDKDQWPDMADPTWNSTVETFYTRN